MALQMPMSFLVPTMDWKAPDMSTLPSWADAQAVSVDVEFCAPNLKTHGYGLRYGGHVAGVAFAIEDGPAHYLPIGHELGGNLPADKVWRYLRDQSAAFKGTLVGNGLQCDLDYLWDHDVMFSGATKIRDIQVADPLLDELQSSYTLDAIAKRWGFEGKDEVLLRQVANAFGVNPKKDLWRLPASAVGAYAEQDVRLPHLIRRKQERRIDDEGLWKVYDLESALLPALVRMKRRGIRVDLDKVEQIERWTVQVEQECWDQVRHATGIQLSVGQAKLASALAPVFDHLGIELPLTPKTQKPTIDKAIFFKYRDNPVVGAIAKAREFSTLRTTFCAQTRRFLVNGKVHSTFNQLRKTDETDDGEEDEKDSEGARYGRCSSTKPNFQQQPTRHPMYGKLWRSIYLPEPGCEWVCADFGQQEPRWLTHYAELAKLPGAKEAADRYRNDPKTDNHQMMAEMTGLPRKDAKIIFLGLCYGMGGAKLCRSLGLPTEIWITPDGKKVEVAGKEGKAILDQFNSRVPYVKLLAKMAEELASKRGYVNAGMRRCHFPKDAHGNYDWAYKALNRVVQGEAANQNKVAIVAADAAGFPLQATIHDELDYSESDRKRAFQLKELMETCYPCLVPAAVDLEIGPNFGEIEKVAA